VGSTEAGATVAAGVADGAVVTRPRPTATYIKRLDKALEALEKLDEAMETRSEAKLNEVDSGRAERTLKFRARLQRFSELVSSEINKVEKENSAWNRYADEVNARNRATRNETPPNRPPPSPDHKTQIKIAKCLAVANDPRADSASRAAALAAVERLKTKYNLREPR
jgi:hypothetical protein